MEVGEKPIFNNLGTCQVINCKLMLEVVYFAPLEKKKNLCFEQFCVCVFQHNHLIQLFLKIAHRGKENKKYFN